MYKEIINLINKYNTIIIHRHKNPDGDALGSQLGLKRLIELNYPTKKVYAVGDENTFVFLGKMDIISDDIYHNALVVILDVSVARLVSDDRYKLADHVIIIDHHLNPADIGDTVVIESDYIACSEIVCDIAIKHNLKLDSIGATPLLAGLVTDSGRFLYPQTSANSFRIAAYLIDNGADIQMVYDKLYTVKLNYTKLRGYFLNNFKTTKNKVAYMKNETSVKDNYQVSTFTVSRAMVNQMSGMEGINIWANFTMDEEGIIQVELRSKKISIVHIARKYGGGGHALACGCTLASFEEADLLLNDLDDLLEKEK
ncbi:MAG: bifunctional oligoribonuclease/PAP phosphatase NrnA [Candidatus Izimaplasma sp.]|nr:bifunctional oligoribonuclease/PAP phosphatase NrnA [Candidatus Izimaplasma bacterium]